MKRVIWALAAALLCEGLATAAGSARDQVSEIIEGRGDARSRAEALAALIELGPAFVPAACELLLTEPDVEDESGLEEGGTPLTAWDPEALLFDALSQFPAREVVQGVEESIRPDRNRPLPSSSLMTMGA